MIFLRESLNPTQARLITEAKDGELYISGIFCQANVKNNNGRTYNRDEMSSQVNRLMNLIKEGHTIMGELDHPNTIQINLDRVSHKIMNLKMDDDNVLGKAMIIGSTPCGAIAKGLLEAGCRLGVSSRGVGNENHNGSVSDFILHTIDIVANPSAPDAYPNIIKESLENNKIMTLAESIQQDPSAQKFLFAEIDKFLKQLIK